MLPPFVNHIQVPTLVARDLRRALGPEASTLVIGHGRAILVLRDEFERLKKTVAEQDAAVNVCAEVLTRSRWGRLRWLLFER